MEEQVLEERDAQMEVMRKYQQLLRSTKTQSSSSSGTGGGEDEMYVEDVLETAGVDRNDPMLKWQNLHSAVPMN